MANTVDRLKTKQSDLPPVTVLHSSFFTTGAYDAMRRSHTAFRLHNVPRGLCSMLLTRASSSPRVQLKCHRGFVLLHRDLHKESASFPVARGHRRDNTGPEQLFKSVFAPFPWLLQPGCAPHRRAIRGGLPALPRGSRRNGTPSLVAATAVAQGL